MATTERTTLSRRPRFMKATSMIPHGLVTDERAEEFFVAGLQAMREMLARFVEQGGHPEVAESMRLNWKDSWGKDPGTPESVIDDCWSA